MYVFVCVCVCECGYDNFLTGYEICPNLAGNSMEVIYSEITIAFSRFLPKLAAIFLRVITYQYYACR